MRAVDEIKKYGLTHVDAWEGKTKKGRAALNFVAGEFTRAKTIVIKSEKSDTYGRFVADVFLSPEETSIEVCFQTGRYLNDLLVHHGHAVAL